MNYDEMSYEELEKAEADLNFQTQILHNQRNEIEEIIYTKFKSVEYAKMVGKCFSYKNSYGNGDDWMEYNKIISFDVENMSYTIINCFDNPSRQETCIKKVIESHDLADRSWITFIDESEFAKHFSEIMEKIKV